MSDPREPHLGLSLGVSPPANLMSLIQELGRRVAVIDAGDAASTDPILVRVEWGEPPARRGPRKEAWWVDEASTRLFGGRIPDIVLSADADVLEFARKEALHVRLVPGSEVEPESTPVPPFVRDRIRRSRDLGDGIVVQDALGRLSWDGAEVVPEVVTTALAAASAAYLVRPETLVRALAWGCPVVAPAWVVRETGADAEAVVAVDDGRDPAEQCADLARDLARSARLSRQGRLRYERAHSISACADEVMAALGVTRRWAPSEMETQLDLLDSRRGVAQGARFGEMVAGIVDGSPTMEGKDRWRSPGH